MFDEYTCDEGMFDEDAFMKTGSWEGLESSRCLERVTVFIHVVVIISFTGPHRTLFCSFLKGLTAMIVIMSSPDPHKTLLR